MATLNEVSEIVDRAASATLRIAGLKVHSEPATDSAGKDAIHVVIVLDTNDIDRITGDDTLDTLVRIRHELESAGEPRFPIVDFVTRDEFDDDAGLED